jgi:integrase
VCSRPSCLSILFEEAEIMAIEKTTKARYRVRLNFRGHRATKTFDEMDGAKQWELDQKRAIKSGHYTHHNSNLVHTPSSFAKAFLDQYDYSDRPHLARLGYWKDVFPHRYVSLDKLDVDHFWDAVAGLQDRGLAASTVSKYLMAWRTIFKFAIKSPRIKIGTMLNPATGVSIDQPSNARTRYLSNREYTALMKAATEQPWTKHHKASEPWECWPLIIQTAILTGARVGNTIGLKWSHIDFEAGKINFPASEQKNKRGYIQQLHPDLAAQLKVWKLKQRPCSYVFAERNSAQDRPHREYGWYWRQSCTTAGIEGLRFHDLRATHASWLESGGASIREIQMSLNHKTPAMTERYCRAGDEVRAKIAAKIKLPKPNES